MGIEPESVKLGQYRGAYGVELDLAIRVIEEDIDTVLEQLDDADSAKVVTTLTHYLGSKVVGSVTK